ATAIGSRIRRMRFEAVGMHSTTRSPSSLKFAIPLSLSFALTPRRTEPVRSLRRETSAVDISSSAKSLRSPAEPKRTAGAVPSASPGLAGGGLSQLASRLAKPTMARKPDAVAAAKCMPSLDLAQPQVGSYLKLYLYAKASA